MLNDRGISVLVAERQGAMKREMEIERIGRVVAGSQATRMESPYAQQRSHQSWRAMMSLRRGKKAPHACVMAATLAVVLALVLALAGCGSPGTSTTQASHTSAGSAGSSHTNSAPASGAPAGKSVTITDAGYVFQVSLSAPGMTTATTYTTNDSSGFGGTPIDAPPGKTLVVATLTVANTTDRQEPLAVVEAARPLDYEVNPQVLLAVPQSDASAFGVPSQFVQYRFGCADGAAPAGYCSLGAMLVGFSPAQTDLTVSPQVAPGSSGTLMILAGGDDIGNFAVPQSAPIQDVKVYVGTTVGGDTSAPGYWAALN